MLLLYPTLKTAHRATQGRVWVSPPFSGVLLLWQRCQVPLQLEIDRLLNGTNREKLCAISHLAGLGAHLGWFYIDKSLVLQLPNVLSNRVSAHASVLADPSNAGPALVRFPVLAENQVGIDR